jgi:predicted acylesterase/phospholipase RssA
VITGGYEVFDESTPYEELPRATISSASIPMVFPYSNYKGYTLIDGGVTNWNTNIVTAVAKCLEIVDDKSKIVVDLAICDLYPTLS